MSLSDADFRSILQDGSKRIEGHISWQKDEDHPINWEFHAKIVSVKRWPLRVYGNYNPRVYALNYTLILGNERRIYALDIGQSHRNPNGQRIGKKHKHRWTEQYGDRYAYKPDDITASASEPVAVWSHFCKEAAIKHNGRLEHPRVQKAPLL